MGGTNIEHKEGRQGPLADSLLPLGVASMLQRERPEKLKSILQRWSAIGHPVALKGNGLIYGPANKAHESDEFQVGR